MGTANQYMQPFFDSLSQGVQVAQHLKQAALQQQQLDQERQAQQARQALAQQEFDAQQQQSLAQALQNGAQPVDSSGKISAPNYAAGTPQRVATPTAPDGLPQGVGSTLLPTLAQSGTAQVDPNAGSTYRIGGQTLAAPTLQDQLMRQAELHNIGKVPLTQEGADAIGNVLPVGSMMDPAHLVGVGSALRAKALADKDESKSPSTQKLDTPDKLAVETAAAALAQKNNVAIDPNKSAFLQLPVSLRAQALADAKQMNADPDVKADRHNAALSALATQELARAVAEQNRQKGAIQLQNLQDAGAQLNPAGKKALESIAPVMAQTDQLLSALEAKNPKDAKGESFKDSNNPLALAAPLMQYKLGIKSQEGELGSRIGDLNLNSLQAIQPFAGKSRNYQYIKDIKQHAPSVGGVLPDSPSLIYGKLQTIQRNFLRMAAGTQKFETAKTSTNPQNPVIPQDKAQMYYHLALGGRDPKNAPDAPQKAAQMAQEDGWQVPTSSQ